MKPSIGRIVHFYSPVPVAEWNYAADSVTFGPFAAIITGVCEDGHRPDDVDLTVFGTNFVQFFLVVPFVADVAAARRQKAAPSMGGCWTWPPRVQP
jgi:hypothetical protein